MEEANSEKVDSTRSRPKQMDNSYKNAAYWQLPENVRKAIDLAKMKSQHSAFYYQLQTLNDKILVFRNIFYNKMPNYQKAFLQKKQEKLEVSLREQKKMFKEHIQSIEEKMNKRFRSSYDHNLENTLLLSKRNSALRASHRNRRFTRHSKTMNLANLDLKHWTQPDDQSRRVGRNKSSWNANRAQDTKMGLYSRAGTHMLANTLPITRDQRANINKMVEGIIQHQRKEKSNEVKKNGRFVSDSKNSSLRQIKESIVEQDDDQAADNNMTGELKKCSQYSNDILVEDSQSHVGQITKRSGIF